MTNKQESTIKMSLASTSFLLANTAITNTLTGFSTYFTVIQATHPQIQAAQVQQEADKSGDTKAKKLLRTTLIAEAIDVVRKTVAYATNVNNNALLALVNYTESDLNKSSDTKLVGSCQVIHDNANTNVAALATYGITAAILTTLQTSINSFNAAIPKGRVDDTDSGEATQLLLTLFNTLKTNWAKIDILVETVKVTQPNFYNEYQSVRQVIPVGTGSLSLKIQVTDSQTGEGVANVTLTITPADPTLKIAANSKKNNIVKKTAAGGGSNVKSLPDGNYIVNAKKPGCKETNTPVSVVNGELTTLNINLDKA